MIHLLLPPVKTNAQPPLLISLAGHVGHAPGRRDPVDAVLIGGTGVQVAEAAPRCSAAQDKAGLAIPGGLADVEAGREIPVERGAASGQHERVGGRKADLLDRRAPEVSVAEPAVVAGAGDHRDMVSGRSQQDGVHLGHLSLGEVMFPQTEADQRHVGAGDGQPQSGEHVGGRVRGAVQGVGGQQDHPESGGGGDRVHDLGVLDFLVSRLPWRACAGQGGHDLDPRGGQPEHAVECRQILAYIAGRRDSRRRGYRGAGGRGAGGRGNGKDRHRLAAAVDPPVQQGLDAILDPEQGRGIAGDRGKQAVGSHAGRGGRAARRGRAVRRGARASRASCHRDHAQQQCGGEQTRSPGAFGTPATGLTRTHGPHRRDQPDPGRGRAHLIRACAGPA